MATKEELENFYRENRIRQAQSVSPTVYDDPANAPTFFGSSLPIGQVERNLQAYGGRLEPYEPTMRENIRTGISDAGQYLGLPQRTSQRLAKGFMGNPSAENFSQQIGLLDLAPVVNIPFYFQEGKRALDRGDYVGGGIDVGFSLLEGLLFAKPFKNFIKSQATKLKSKPSTTEIVDTKETVGALPNVIANTAKKQPSMAMVNTKLSLDDIKNKYSNVDLDVYNDPKGLTLSKIVVPEGVRSEGIGSNVMNDLIKYADENNKPIALTPDNSFGGSKTRLKSFYKKFGFKENKGRNKDFAFRETMIRQPKVLANVIANTKLKAPSMAMKDPKVVDEFGFYSEAERQAKMMQQNKGSGAQFAGFLLNKGVKQDELDAIGLTDLFKNDNVTKKEIIDTIELNKVQLIETKKTAKAFTDPNDPYLDDFDPETFTNIRNGEEGFKTADEVKEAHETGRYSQPTIEYDAKIRTYANSDETESMKLYGSINTHMPTQYKILELGNLSDEGQDITDIYLTFRPNADVKDWRNSVEASTYADEQGFDVKDLDLDDFAEIIQDRTAQTFAEATVRLRGATIAYGDYDPGIMAKWEGSTQDGGTNYKELLLRLPPKGNNRFGKNDDLANPKLYTKGKDFQYTTHFDEFNPLFHIRTKDRVTNDGKKVLYVEELQSDWGQRGAGRGFKLEGDELAAAKKELADVSKELTDLKKGGVKLDGYEQEAFYKLAFPNRPPIRIPFLEPKDFRAKHDFSPTKYYDTEGNVKDYDFDYSQSRMPEEFKTMTFGQYMNFHESMGRYRKGELNDASLQYRKDSILNPEDSINKYYDNKDADFLFGQINQPSFNADGNKFIKDLSKKYLKKYNAIQGGVPSAPFVTDRNKWTGLAIKRLIKLADEGGYDHVAFTPGAVQLDRWGKQSLVDYYDKIIPQVASKLPKSLGVTTEKITIPIKPKVDVGVAVTYDGRYFVRNDGSDKAIEGKFFKNEGDAFDYADMIRDSRTNQETFAINITPKMKETLRGGMPLFSTVGGMVGLGALGSMPSTQDGGT